MEQRVYKKLLDVPKGQITTYGELAKAVGLKNGQRAIGKIMNNKSLSSNSSMSSRGNVYWKNWWLCIW